MTQKNTSGTKLFYRFLAMVLVVVFLLAFIVGSNIRIKISAVEGSDAENAAADYLISNTEYINENIIARTRMFLKTRFVASTHFDDFYNRASLSIANGSYEDALSNIKSCIGLLSGSDSYILEDLYIKKGCLEAMLGDYTNALLSFENLEDASRLRGDIGQIIVQIYIEQSSLNKAKDYLEEYLVFAAEDSLMQGIYAQVLYTLGEYESAIDVYNTMIGRGEDEGGINHLMRALCCEQANRYENAIADFICAVDKGYEDTGMCYYHIALGSYILGNSTDAIKYCTLAIENRSEQVALGDVYNIKGLSHFQLGEYESAIENFTLTLENDETMHGVYYYRGVCYMVTEKYNEAVADYSASIEHDVQVGLSYYNSGLCNMQLGKMSEAKSDFEKVADNTDDEDIVASAKEFINMLG